ncbi:MAG: AbrB/MazE/SpoVT family DNA-binding domain-containing protein [Clostridia bacterium]|nr:AbrB/MazE/SpoVT family DNA-binding domain-containing protein [Clostridia bacterium]
MKSLGLIRKIDNLGRLVIPKEIREVLFLEENSSVEIILTTEGIILRPASYEVVIIPSGEKKEE